ncbi:hypothetical protein [Archangium sp.]|uniref:hypothetical protein n=1 Tax=Archangium sp. TaxID=1872627 RepID=UPI002D71D2AA|nr:hypothetical protein [Archangium sp.]HYO57833.1 hypothetical protein [Archangium sp.]
MPPSRASSAAATYKGEDSVRLGKAMFLEPGQLMLHPPEEPAKSHETGMTGSFTQLNLLLEEGEALRFAMRNGGDGALNEGMMLTVKSTAP